MKISLNLAFAPSSRERYALAWAVPVTLLALAGLVLLSGSAARSLREYRQVRRERLKVQEQEAALSKVEIDLRRQREQPRFRGLVRQAEFVNALIDQKRLSVIELTDKVAKLLPDSVHLTGLAVSEQQGNHVVRFMVTGKNLERLEDFLTRLEDSADFKDVGNLNWGFGQESASEGPVTLTCTARYVGNGQG
jgi:hypothetical protein